MTQATLPEDFLAQIPSGGSAPATVSHQVPHRLEPFYNLPDGGINVAAAAQKYSVTQARIVELIREGDLEPVGRLIARDPGQIIIDDQALCDKITDNRDQRIFAKVPPGMIDLPTAAKQYDQSVDTLRTWVKRKLLPTSGRVRSGAPGGGTWLFDISAIEEFLQDRGRLNR